MRETTVSQKPARQATGGYDRRMVVLLTIIFSGVNNCYWLTLYNVTNLPGNKFINGLMLGAAELSSGVFAGMIISKTDSFRAFQICGIMGIAFNSMS